MCACKCEKECEIETNTYNMQTAKEPQWEPSVSAVSVKSLPEFQLALYKNIVAYEMNKTCELLHLRLEKFQKLQQRRKHQLIYEYNAKVDECLQQEIRNVEDERRHQELILLRHIYSASGDNASTIASGMVQIYHNAKRQILQTAEEDTADIDSSYREGSTDTEHIEAQSHALNERRRHSVAGTIVTEIDHYYFNHMLHTSDSTKDSSVVKPECEMVTPSEVMKPVTEPECEMVTPSEVTHVSKSAESGGGRRSGGARRSVESARRSQSADVDDIFVDDTIMDNTITARGSKSKVNGNKDATSSVKMPTPNEVLARSRNFTRREQNRKKRRNRRRRGSSSKLPVQETADWTYNNFDNINPSNASVLLSDANLVAYEQVMTAPKNVPPCSNDAYLVVHENLMTTPRDVPAPSLNDANLVAHEHLMTAPQNVSVLRLSDANLVAHEYRTRSLNPRSSARRPRSCEKEQFRHTVGAGDFPRLRSGCTEDRFLYSSRRNDSRQGSRRGARDGLRTCPGNTPISHWRERVEDLIEKRREQGDNRECGKQIPSKQDTEESSSESVKNNEVPQETIVVGKKTARPARVVHQLRDEERSRIARMETVYFKTENAARTPPTPPVVPRDAKASSSSGIFRFASLPAQTVRTPRFAPLASPLPPFAGQRGGLINGNPVVRATSRYASAPPERPAPTLPTLPTGPFLDALKTSMSSLKFPPLFHSVNNRASSHNLRRHPQEQQQDHVMQEIPEEEEPTRSESSQEQQQQIPMPESSRQPPQLLRNVTPLFGMPFNPPPRLNFNPMVLGPRHQTPLCHGSATNAPSLPPQRSGAQRIFQSPPPQRIAQQVPAGIAQGMNQRSLSPNLKFSLDSAKVAEARRKFPLPNFERNSLASRAVAPMTGLLNSSTLNQRSQFIAGPKMEDGSRVFSRLPDEAPVYRYNSKGELIPIKRGAEE